jgi:protein-tyrosine phosphatase
MFSIFKRKSSVNNLEWLGVDMHSHLLPGIDDGSPDVETSIYLIQGLKDLGFSKLLCTPHIFPEIHPNTPETISPALAKVELALKSGDFAVDMGAAAEHMIDDSFEVQEGLMCLPGNHILIEMSYLNESPNIEQVIFDLQIEGYKVILAHPERYVFYHNSHQRFHRFKDMGVLFQLNLLAVTGYYGKEVKQAADYLLAKGCYDLAGTDLHHDKHLQVLSKWVLNGDLYRKIGIYPFKNKDLFL